MFEPGVLIVHGNSGICRVEEITMKTTPAGAQAPYYTLTPVFGSGTVYAPVESKVFMRPVLTRSEADALLQQMPEIEPCCCAGTDQRSLAEHYRKLLHTYQCESLVKIIKAVGVKKQQALARGKKLGKTDQQFRKKAEELLCEELSLALEQSQEQVREQVRRILEPAAP